MKKIFQVAILMLMASAQPILAAVVISTSSLCASPGGGSTVPEFVMATITDASGNPKPNVGVRFSAVSGNPAEFLYPLTYTNEQGRAVSVLSLIGTPITNQVQIQAEDLSTSELSTQNVPISSLTICETVKYVFKPIIATVGNPFIATGDFIGFRSFGGSKAAYSTDPRVAAPVRFDVSLDGYNTATLEIDPHQAGQAYFLADSNDYLVSGPILNVPVTVLAPDVNAPVITSQPKTATDIYRPYLYQVIASSPLGKTLTYALTDGPAGMQINAQTGLLAWTPALENIGQHVIQLTASDGKLSTYQHFRLQVSNTQTVFAVDPVTVSGESGTVISWTPLVINSFSPILPTCAIETTPGNGTASVAADCSSGTYQSHPGFIGTDNFFYNATICPTPSGPCYFDSATVTVAVTEPPPVNACLAQYPVTQFTQTGKQGTLSITFTGNITSHTHKEVKVCPGTTLDYQSTSTQGPVICKIRNSTTRGSGTLRVNDHLKCTDKPVGKDKLSFKVKSGAV